MGARIDSAMGLRGAHWGGGSRRAVVGRVEVYGDWGVGCMLEVVPKQEE